MARWRYRIGQFWRGFRPQPLPAAAIKEIEVVLQEQEQLLFWRLAVNDQRHSYAVMQSLLAAGREELDLLAAALLHDAGKTSQRLGLKDRTLIVLGQALAPKRAAAWGQGVPRGWRRPFVVKSQHATWGAEMAQAAGSRPGTIALVRRHQERLTAIQNEEDSLLRLLQWADDRN